MTDPRTVFARVEHRLRQQLVPGPLVLCFHSVRPDDRPNDVIGAITRSRFSAMLEVIQRVGRVVPLEELVSGRGRTTARERRIALTFDDGYHDNFDVVIPMLERREMPAAFFITTSMLDQRDEYAWDSLQQIIGNAAEIPDTICLVAQGENHLWCSDADDFSHRGGACTRFSSRDDLYASLLRFLNPLAPAIQRDALRQLRSLLGVRTTVRPECRTMSCEELQRLSAHPLATIGSHTVSHAELPHLSREQRVRELLDSRRALEEVIGCPVDTLAYPYGGFDSLSNEIARECGYSTTFTIEPRSVRSVNGRMLLPRLMLRASDFDDLERTLVWMFGT